MSALSPAAGRQGSQQRAPVGDYTAGIDDSRPRPQISFLAALREAAARCVAVSDWYISIQIG